MHQTFYIEKKSGTYADTLEAYGLANLLAGIFLSKTISHKIIINDAGLYFEIKSNKPITQELVDSLEFFQVIWFIQKNEKNILPKNIGQEFYNYPEQRDLRKQRKVEIEKAIKETKGKPDEYKKRKKQIDEKYSSEKTKGLQVEFDVFAQLVSNPYAAFLKIYNNFENNQKYFKDLITETLNYYLPNQEKYSSNFIALQKAKKIKIEEKATMLQLLNPNQGKGLNKGKATGISTTNLKGNWIQETMKVSGALNLGMTCQLVKVGSSYDLKVFVPEFNNISLGKKKTILKDFKKHAKSNSPIKLDILNMLSIIEIFIENHEQYTGQLKNSLIGIHSVYQKDLGQNKAVANIGFLETPDFIKIENEEDSEEWLDVIEEQKKLINGITELGDATVGLLAYRNFLNGSNVNQYFKFHYWYAPYLMHELSNKKQTYVTTNKIEILNKIFPLMNTSFKDIVENQGFQRIAAAIRKSTIELQRQKINKEKPKPIYEIKYGLAQKLKINSSSKDRLLSFLTKFLADYFNENILVRERFRNSTYEELKQRKIYFRDAGEENIIYTDVLDEFLIVFENPKFSPNVIGGLLAAYGFASKKYKKDE